MDNFKENTWTTCTGTSASRILSLLVLYCFMMQSTTAETEVLCGSIDGTMDLDCGRQSVIEVERTYITRAMHNFECGQSVADKDQCVVYTRAPKKCNSRRQCTFQATNTGPNNCQEHRQNKFVTEYKCIADSSVTDICHSESKYIEQTRDVYYIGNPCFPNNGPRGTVDCNCEVEGEEALTLTPTAVYLELYMCDSSSQCYEELLSTGSFSRLHACDQSTCTAPSNHTVAGVQLEYSLSVADWTLRFKKTRSGQNRRGRFLLKLRGDKPFKIDCEQEDDDRPSINCLSTTVPIDAATLTTDSILTTDVTEGYTISQNSDSGNTLAIVLGVCLPALIIIIAVLAVILIIGRQKRNSARLPEQRPAYEQVSVAVLGNLAHHSNPHPDQNRTSYTNQAYEEIPYDAIMPINHGDNSLAHVPVHPTDSSSPNDMTYEVIRNSALATLTERTRAPDVCYPPGEPNGKDQDSRNIVPININNSASALSEHHLAQPTTKDAAADTQRSDSKPDPAMDSMESSNKSHSVETPRPASILMAENTVYDLGNDDSEHTSGMLPAQSLGGKESYPYEAANPVNEGVNEIEGTQDTTPLSLVSDKPSDEQLDAQPVKEAAEAERNSSSDAGPHTQAPYRLAKAASRKENFATDSTELTESSSAVESSRPDSILVAENTVYDLGNDESGILHKQSVGSQESYPYEEASPVNERAPDGIGNNETEGTQDTIPTRTIPDKPSDYQLAQPMKDAADTELDQAAATKKETPTTDSTELIEKSSQVKSSRPGSILVAENTVYEGSDNFKDTKL